MKQHSSHPYIIHTPEAVAGNASTLAEAERALGWYSRLYFLSSNLYDSLTPDDHPINRGWTRPLAMLRVFIVAATKATHVHFNAGRSLIPPPLVHYPNDRFIKKILKRTCNLLLLPIEWLDVKFFCYLGKRVFVTFQGDDGRLHSYHRKHYSITHVHCFEEIIENARDAEKIRRQNCLFKTKANVFSVNPDLIQTMKPNAQFLPYTSVNLEKWSFIRSSNNQKKTIIHAPSHLGVKGSSYIQRAVEELKHEGFDFNFQLITGVPRNKVRELYASADLLIDQLLVGWYGGVAVECMALGVPVACYIREEDLCNIPLAMRLEMPILRASPTSIKEVLRHFLEETGENLERRLASRRYVERWHNPKTIAQFLEQFPDTITELNPG